MRKMLVKDSAVYAITEASQILLWHIVCVGIIFKNCHTFNICYVQTLAKHLNTISVNPNKIYNMIFWYPVYMEKGALRLRDYITIPHTTQLVSIGSGI